MIADELGIKRADAKNMVAAVELMQSKGEPDNHKYSYYYEYVKDANIRKYRDTTNIDDRICEQITKGEIEKAEDIRKLGKVAKVNDKQSKKLINQYISGNVSIYDAHESMEENGKLEPAVNKLKTFRNYINEDSFEKNVRSSEEGYKNAKYEIEKILKRLNQLKKKWDKLDG